LSNKLFVAGLICYMCYMKPAAVSSIQFRPHPEDQLRVLAMPATAMIEGPGSLLYSSGSNMLTLRVMNVYTGSIWSGGR